MKIFKERAWNMGEKNREHNCLHFNSNWSTCAQNVKKWKKNKVILFNNLYILKELHLGIPKTLINNIRCYYKWKNLLNTFLAS